MTAFILRQIACLCRTIETNPFNLRWLLPDNKKSESPYSNSRYIAYVGILKSYPNQLSNTRLLFTGAVERSRQFSISSIMASRAPPPSTQRFIRYVTKQSAPGSVSDLRINTPPINACASHSSLSSLANVSYSSFSLFKSSVVSDAPIVGASVSENSNQ